MEAIREIIHSPQDWSRIRNTLPASFAGRELELIIIPKERTEPTKTEAKDAKLFGALHKYADPQRMSHESSAWKESVKDA